MKYIGKDICFLKYLTRLEYTITSASNYRSLCGALILLGLQHYEYSAESQGLKVFNSGAIVKAVPTLSVAGFRVEKHCNSEADLQIPQKTESLRSRNEEERGASRGEGI